jgi:phosphoglycerate dehydrogenase-like enzyme
MIPIVLSILPLNRFQAAEVALPPDLNFIFKNALEEDEIIAVCSGADFLFLPAVYPLITRRVLENIPSVCMIQSAGAGYDKVDVRSAARLGIPVANSPGENSVTVAEFTLALLIALQRLIVTADREIKAGNYAPLREQFFQSGLKEVKDTRLGLVGLGAIGKQVAKLTGLLGARVSYYDVRRADKRLEEELRITYMPFDQLIGSCDAISLHVPLTGATKGLIGRREFDRMRPGTLLINTSRGEVVDQQALAEALDGERLDGAAIDTVSPEPPPPDHPLLNLSPTGRDRLLITPHIAGITKGAFNRMLRGALANILRVAAGANPLNVVNGISEARRPR